MRGQGTVRGEDAVAQSGLASQLSPSTLATAADRPSPGSGARSPRERPSPCRPCAAAWNAR